MLSNQIKNYLIYALTIVMLGAGIIIVSSSSPAFKAFVSESVHTTLLQETNTKIDTLTRNVVKLLTQVDTVEKPVYKDRPVYVIQKPFVPQGESWAESSYKPLPVPKNISKPNISVASELNNSWSWNRIKLGFQDTRPTKNLKQSRDELDLITGVTFKNRISLDAGVDYLFQEKEPEIKAKLSVIF